MCVPLHMVSLALCATLWVVSLAWRVTLQFVRTVSSYGFVSLVWPFTSFALCVALHMVSVALCVTLHITSLAWYDIHFVCNVCDHSYRFVSSTCDYTSRNSSACFFEMTSYSSRRFVRIVCVKPLCSFYNLEWHTIQRRFLSRFFVTRIPTQK
jgi:hypothetical protein